MQEEYWVQWKSIGSRLLVSKDIPRLFHLPRLWFAGKPNAKAAQKAAAAKSVRSAAEGRRVVREQSDSLSRQ